MRSFILEKNNFTLTDKNLDRLSHFLDQIADNPTQHLQIPDGAHIFYGAADDIDLTNANIRLASRILLGISLGYVEEASLVMVYQNRSGEKLVINLSSEAETRKVQSFINQFQVHSQKEIANKINTSLVA